jgi:hypothetical protein
LGCGFGAVFLGGISAASAGWRWSGGGGAVAVERWRWSGALRRAPMGSGGHPMGPAWLGGLKESLGVSPDAVIAAKGPPSVTRLLNFCKRGCYWSHCTLSTPDSGIN